MPVAIVVLPDTIPAIFSETDDARLVARLATLKGAPALADVADARAWLASLVLPSGWFADEAAARAFVAQCKAPETMTPSVFAHIREESGMTREAFGAALGYAGNSNTRHKQVLQMERGEKPILAEKAVRARAIAAESAITKMRRPEEGGWHVLRHRSGTNVIPAFGKAGEGTITIKTVPYKVLRRKVIKPEVESDHPSPPAGTAAPRRNPKRAE